MLAQGGLQQCIDKAANHGGEPPTCTKVDGKWVATWPGDSSIGDPSSGASGAFVLLFVLAAVVGVALLLWKVSTARTLARQSGMDERLATQVTLLSDDGFESTYLASQLRPATTPPAPPLVAGAPASRTAAERLTELKTLLEQGMITQAEHDERREAIVRSL